MTPGFRFAAPAAAAVAVTLGATSAGVHAQYFGRNKIQYEDVEFRVLATAHFDLHYARADAEAAAIAARLAERWYARLSRVLDHELTGRQPLVLYGSHRAFEQTNVVAGLVDETTGGFTESRRRRIVLPFAASLAETDHVLGHEIVHAFQYDIASRHGGLALPLWFVEGMAEYLSVGADDPLTAMWMRDEGRDGELPAIRDLSSPKLFPYRYGAALWAYLAGRFGEDLPARALRSRRDAIRRLEEATGVSAAQLSADWHAALRHAAPEVEDGAPRETSRALVSRRRGGGRLNLAGTLSPDGRRIVFLSERDQLSVDVFLADAATGVVTRKLITTAVNPAYESLQFLRSAGAWDPGGRRFALATVRRGRPSITIVDVDRPERTREIPQPQFGEVLGPAWSPDGRTMAFAALTGGFTDLFVLDLATGAVRRLTADAYADLQPAWSPDGRTLAFATDRFTSDLRTLRLGASRLAFLDVASGAIRAAPAMPGAKHIDPAWAPDGESVYLVADPGGVSNVFRLDLACASFFQVTDVETGVSGATRLSPALSVAQRAGVVAFTLFRARAYEIHVIDDVDRLAGVPVTLEPEAAVESDPDAGSRFVDSPAPESTPPPVEAAGTPYRPALGLEALGSPYFSAVGGSVGTSFRGGMSVLFGDLLGNRQLYAAAEVSSRLAESAVHGLYLNRESRWTWGASLEQAPDLRLRRRQQRRETPDGSFLDREDERWLRLRTRAGAFVAYPFNRAERVELSAGLRRLGVDRRVERRTYALETGRLIDRRGERLDAGGAIGGADVGVALVHDAAIFGAVDPILGTRYRFQVAPVFGGLSYTQVLADYRRYFMPRRPYTIAVRLLHSGRYGRDAGDVRLPEGYLGSPSLVRGYGSRDVVRSECPDRAVECEALERLLGSRLLVAKLEVRFPLLGALSPRITYGGLPLEGLLFADAGTVWSGATGAGRAAIRSVGAGVRASAMGLAVEVAAVRPLDLRRDGWKLVVNLLPGY
jgi:hypothetical protein